MLVIVFISFFEYTYFLKLVFLSIYHIHSLGHIFICPSFGHNKCLVSLLRTLLVFGSHVKKLVNKFLAPLPGTLVSLW